MAEPWPDRSVDRIVVALTAARVTFATGQLVCVDGFSASGKTTVADALQHAAAATGRVVRTLHTDALLPGWEGLGELEPILTALLAPLAAGEPSSWRAWDWHRSDWGPHHREPAVVPGELVILEGVGASVGRAGQLASLRVWQDSNPAAQEARWAERGDDLSRLRQWVIDEQALHARWGTRERADLLLD